MKNNILQMAGYVWINGERVARCPGVNKSKRTISVIKDNNIYINGYEYFSKGDYWKCTWKAFLDLFNRNILMKL